MRLANFIPEQVGPEPRGYVWGGAGTGDTMRANLEAFRRWRLVPRMLRDISRRSLQTTVLGTEMPAPVLLAPIGVQTIVHPDRELRAIAKGRPGKKWKTPPADVLPVIGV